MRMLILTELMKSTRSSLYRVVEAYMGMGLRMPMITKTINPSTVTMSIKLTEGRRIASVKSKQGLLDVIRSDSKITMAEMARATGLSTSTVSSRVKEQRLLSTREIDGTGYGSSGIGCDLRI